MSAMGESLYPIHAGRSLHHGQDLTPYSAVSSFNFPAHCDSTLITPIAMTQSPTVPNKTTPIMRPERDIKLSPSSMSPSYHFLDSEDDYGNRNYNHNPPMKHKYPSGTLHVSTSDSSFPVSPFVCPSPHWGPFGVSATPLSGRSESSPSIHPSPNMHSAGELSNSSSHSRQQTPAQSAATYRSQNQAPILIAPNPSSLRSATKQEGGPYRQNSLHSISTAPSSAKISQGPFPEPLGSLPSRRKRKTPPRNSSEREMVFSADKTQEEELLLDLSLKKQLPWKELQRTFNDITGKSMKVPALQMRKKRIIERLRVWTDDDERALTLAVEELDKNRWETIADNMMKYGCVVKWPKELCEKKWQEMHPEEGPYIHQYNTVLQRRFPEDLDGDDGAWSDGRLSVSHSLHEGDSGVLMSSISTTTMDEVRSRAASDASPHMHLQHQQHQQMMFDQQQQQQHNGWGPEN